MRFSILIVGILLASSIITGCTLSARSAPTPQIVTATLDPDLSAALNSTPTPIVTAPANPTATRLPTATPLPTHTSIPTMPPPPTFTPIPSPLPPTRTRPAPPPVPIIDDGSGNAVPITGGAARSFSPVAGLAALPHTLYFLSDYGSTRQVFRVQIGLPYAEQLTFSPTGVLTFDVAPDGTLAYITWNGDLVIGSVPFLPPVNPDGSYPKVSTLAWSPDGSQLAFNLYMPGLTDSPPGTTFPTEGLWIRDRAGTVRQLHAIEQFESGTRHYSLRSWRPDSSELLVSNPLNPPDYWGQEFVRVNVTTGDLFLVWDSSDPIYEDAAWTWAGDAILLSNFDSIARIDLSGGSPVTIMGPDPNINPNQLTEFQSGVIIFEGIETEVSSLFSLEPGHATPQRLTEGLTSLGKLEIEWGTASEEIVIVIKAHYDDPFGTAYFRDASGTLYDLTPLAGLVSQPQWGPTFKRGDRAIVYSADPLNVRSIPGGPIMRNLVSGAPVIIIDGPRELDGYTWWQIQTPDNQTGWSVESLPAADGSRTRTLYPASN